MAVMYPIQCDYFTNTSEQYVYNYLKNNLPDQCRVYYNRFVEERQMDFFVIVPMYGLAVIEVKNWEGSFITQVAEDLIEYKASDSTIKKKHAPINQCRNYCFKLNEVIYEELGLNLYVAPVIIYPNMSEMTFEEKGLQRVSPRNITFLKEDLEAKNEFFNQLVKKITHYNIQHYDRVSYKNIIRIRQLFESKAEIESNTVEEELQEIQWYTRENYSILSFIGQCDQQEMNHCVDRYLAQWKKGTKLILFSNSDQLIRRIDAKLREDENFKYLLNNQEFVFKEEDVIAGEGRIFNLEIYRITIAESMYGVEIKDGQVGPWHETLEQLDESTHFNYRQYILEHVDTTKNIAVSAGAGTGKTYSMISRINFLVYKEQFTPEELIESIFMITFTNEAADNMKLKLKQYFEKMYILTENIYFLLVTENISRMNISTIHALVKKIITYYSTYLGVGTTINIESGIYKRRQLITEMINQYVDADPHLLQIAAQYEKYELVTTVERILGKLENKNVELVNDYELGKLDMNEDNKKLFTLIVNVAKEVQKQGIANDIEENTVQLSNLMLYLNRIIDQIEEVNKCSQEQLGNRIKYLFVDEYQDTDDMQIDLMSRFYKLLKFKLFVVGDIKQCIYRFRGADDNAFEILRKKTDGWHETLYLNKNYRSLNELLDAFDACFTQWGTLNLLKYSGSFKDGSRLIGVKTNPAKAKLEYRTFTSEENFEQEFASLVKEKQSQLKDKETLAILTRDNEMIDKIKKISKAYELKIQTKVADNLYETEAALDLYKLICALQFNKNPKYLYNLSTTHYAKRITNRVVYAHRHEPQYITQLFYENKILTGWNKYIEKLYKEPVLRVIRQIITDIRPWEQYAYEVASNNEDFYACAKMYKQHLDLLIEMIMKRGRDEYITLNKLKDFLYMMIFTKQQEDAKEDQEELQQRTVNTETICTTVHKSKGLEYTHVIVPYTDFNLDDMKGNEVIVDGKKIGIQIRMGEQTSLKNDIFKSNTDEKQAKLEEETRILYVAMTRAQETFTYLKQNLGTSQKTKKETWQTLLERGEV